jgi:hypothetical protein
MSLIQMAPWYSLALMLVSLVSPLIYCFFIGPFLIRLATAAIILDATVWIACCTLGTFASLELGITLAFFLTDTEHGSGKRWRTRLLPTFVWFPMYLSTYALAMF